MNRSKIARFAQSRMSCGIALLLLFGSTGFAQTMIEAGINSPIYSLVDSNLVNLTSNKPTLSMGGLTIGDRSNPLSHTVSSYYDLPYNQAVSFIDNYYGRIMPALDFVSSPSCVGTNSSFDVVIGGTGDRMCGTAGGSYVPQRDTGTRVTTNPDGTLVYTQKDGTQFLFGDAATPNWLLTRITAPNGRITTLTYKSVSIPGTIYRLQSVARNDGLQLKYSYSSNVTPTNETTAIPWTQLASVRAINNVVDYCDPQADSCSFTQTWPVTTQSWATSGSLKYLTVTDSVGRATRVTTGIPTLSGGIYGPNVTNYTGHQVLAVRWPSSTSADNITYVYCAYSGEAYCMYQGIKGLTANGTVWTYSGTSGTGGPSVFIQLTAARSGGGSQVTVQQRGNSAQGPLLSYTDGLRQFYFENSLANRMYRVLPGDGDRLDYAFDGRSNIIQETHTPISGSPLAATVKTANYDATCSNPITCNKPNWIRDAKGNQTDYQYDPTHGSYLKITSPPSASGVRAQTRYTYGQRYAWYKNSSGTVVQAATPIWVLTTEKYCRQSAALSDGSGCVNPLDETTVSYDYGPTTGANNLFLRGTAVTADGITLRICYGNDNYGNRISETRPKAGLSSCP